SLISNSHNSYGRKLGLLCSRSISSPLQWEGLLRFTATFLQVRRFPWLQQKGGSHEQISRFHCCCEFPPRGRWYSNPGIFTEPALTRTWLRSNDYHISPS